MKNNQTLPIVVVLAAILLAPGCTRTTVISAPGVNPPTAIVATIQDVRIMPPYGHKPWRIHLIVNDVETASPDVVQPGDGIDIYVHSPSRTFAQPAEDLKGQTFKITYLDKFAPDYVGEVKVEVP